MMMDIDPALQGAMETFFEESRDLLLEMEQILLGVETHGLEAEQLNALFRAAHTIKGSAGLFGLDPLVRFTHRLENLLDRIRGGQQVFAAEQMVPLLLACADHLGAYLAMLQGSDAFQPDFLAEDVRLLEALEAVQQRRRNEVACQHRQVIARRHPWRNRQIPLPQQISRVRPNLPAGIFLCALAWTPFVTAWTRCLFCSTYDRWERFWAWSP